MKKEGKRRKQERPSVLEPEVLTALQLLQGPERGKGRKTLRECCFLASFKKSSREDRFQRKKIKWGRSPGQGEKAQKRVKKVGQGIRR